MHRKGVIEIRAITKLKDTCRASSGRKAPPQRTMGGFRTGFSAIVGELRFLCEETCYCKGILTRN